MDYRLSLSLSLPLSPYIATIYLPASPAASSPSLLSPTLSSLKNFAVYDLNKR